MNIIYRINELTTQKGLTGKELGAVLGLKKSPLTDWKNGKSKPTLEQLILLCEYFAVSSDFLIFGKGSDNDILNLINADVLETFNTLTTKQQEMLKNNISELQELNNLKNQISKVEKTSKLKVVEPKKASIKAEIIPIEKILLPVTPQPASAGIGKYMLDDDSFEKMEFDLDHRTQKADHAIIVDGDSMYPTIENGEYIFVREQQTIENNEVGIFVYEDKVYCKRLHIDYKKKQLTLLSDNEDYDDILIENIDNLRTIGKVIL